MADGHEDGHGTWEGGVWEAGRILRWVREGWACATWLAFLFFHVIDTYGGRDGAKNGDDQSF